MNVSAFHEAAVQWVEPSFLRDPVITSDALLRRGPGPAHWSARGEVAFYRVSGPESMSLQVMVAKPNGEVDQWSEEPFRAYSGQGSVMDRNFAGTPAFSPDGSLLAVAGTEDRDSVPGIYIFSGPGESRRLTRTFAAHRHPSWSPASDRLAFVATSGGKDSIWLVPLEGGASRELVPVSYNACNPVWSPDGRFIAFAAQLSIEDPLSCQVAVVEVASGTIKVLTPGGRVHSRFPRWAPDGTSLYVLSDAYGIDAIWRVDAATGRMERVTPKRNYDVCEFDVSISGSEIVYVAVDRTDHQLWICNSTSGTARRLDAAHGVHRWPAFSQDGEYIWVRYETPNSPPEPFIYESGGDTAPIKVSDWLAPSTPQVAIDQVEFRSGDGQLVDAVLYAPTNRPKGARYPALLWVHGGPNAQHTNGYWPLFRHLAARGFVILAPNCRGSTGYGREWMDANIHDWGEGDRKDWIAAVRYLKSLPYVAEDATGLWGRSYGGYSTVRGLALNPEQFDAGIAHFGPVDLTAFYEETTVRHLMLHNFGQPHQNPASYERCSSHQHLDSIAGPLMLMQGAADAGVPPPQMDMVYESLAGRDHPVWYVRYEREGHGFDEPEHIFDAAGKIRWFWSNKLAGLD